VLLPEDDRGHQSGFGSLNLRLVVRIGDLELSDESHQECLHLDHAMIEEGGFQCSGRVNNIRDDQRTRLAMRCSS